MNKRLVLSAIIGILVITAAVLIYDQQTRRSKNAVIYANQNQIEELKKRIKALRENNTQ